MSEPDVSIGARVKAKRVRFRAQPSTRVEFYGEPEVESASGSRRKNLPDKVKPGVTYGDVEVIWTAGARFRDRPRRDD